MWLLRLFLPEPTRPTVPLTEDAGRVFAAAVRAARRNGDEYIGTNHLLLGVAEAGPTPALEALERAGIAPAAVRERCASPPGLGQVRGPLPLTPWAERVLAAAWQAARLQAGEGTGSIDLLVALVREGQGEAREVLAGLAAA